MSQSTAPQVFDGSQDGGYNSSQVNEFDYRPVPVLAPVSLCLGVLSAFGFLGILAAPIGLFGVIASVVCLFWLRKRRGEYGGMWLAVTGFVLSLVCFVGSTGLWAYTYQTEVPSDCRRINFTSDISKKGFAKTKNSPDPFVPEVKSLEGQKIFIKGYMYPTKDIFHLSSFLLVKDTGQCCFGGNPAITDMILINMEPGKTVDYKKGMVSVAGVFHCQPAGGPEGLMPVYTMDGTFVESSRTLF
jgi:hypothetical protein